MWALLKGAKVGTKIRPQTKIKAILDCVSTDPNLLAKLYQKCGHLLLHDETGLATKPDKKRKSNPQKSVTKTKKKSKPSVEDNNTTRAINPTVIPSIDSCTFQLMITSSIPTEPHPTSSITNNLTQAEETQLSTVFSDSQQRINLQNMNSTSSRPNISTNPNTKTRKGNKSGKAANKQFFSQFKPSNQMADETASNTTSNIQIITLKIHRQPSRKGQKYHK
ncbi:hypothetical protein FDP41_004537 [Naegleria fowleri]|uniref:Uncharacterized protein n=1 Tax=Naegleria fowleri TaxID=5763 RepID=A0A6A5BR00_NAEFO|nr:uncharacterized protein FDP41_004537 [Naegleria fowleri]KAF0976638.1 hypothetical protein FDP41_004537 [Naegleria fowleri]